MASINDDEPPLLGVHRAPVWALAGDQGIDAELVRLAKRVCVDASARADRPVPRATPRRDCARDRGASVRSGEYVQLRNEIGGRDIAGTAHTAVDRLVAREAGASLQTKLPRKQERITERWMGIERQMGGIQRHVVIEEEPDSRVVRPRDRL